MKKAVFFMILFFCWVTAFGQSANSTRVTDVISMLFVQGGTFTMGCTSEQGSDCDDDEKPAHQVTVSSFYIGRYPITQKQWQIIMNNNPSFHKGDDLPVENVRWDDVQDFIRKLNTATGRKYRLPTEAEWEYAARGGNISEGYQYSGSNHCSDVAWHADNSGYTTHPVGTKQPNELGIYDMSGNVLEWCQDEGYYSDNTHTYRVVRGGCFRETYLAHRVSERNQYRQDSRVGMLGFRVALSQP